MPYKYSIVHHPWRWLLVIVSLLLGAPVLLHATQNVKLAWDPDPGSTVAGYRIQYGTSPGNYTQSIDVGNATSGTVADLANGDTYYFVVVAYGPDGLLSDPSNEVSFLLAQNLPPAVSLTGPTNGTTMGAPANVVLAATASDSDGTISRVEFYQGLTKLGEDTSSPFTITWSGVAAGTYSLTALAFDDQGASGVSSAITLNVSATATPSPPIISSAEYLKNGSAQLTVAGIPGATAKVYASTDLKNWTLIATVVNTTGILSISDKAASLMERRFYRVKDLSGTSDPGGFIKLDINGASRTAAALTYLGLNLTNSASYKGRISSQAAGSITDAQATWNDDQFGGGNGRFYIEITSGPYAGLVTDILGTDAATRSLTTDDDISSLLTGGESYTIRRHRTIGDVFGNTNSVQLNGGTSLNSADEIRVFNPITQSFEVFYYQTGGVGGTGWRSATDSTTDASDTTLYLDQGLVICRKQLGKIKLVLAGAVKIGPTVVPVGPNFNLVANVYPVGTLTLGNSGLFGSPSSGLFGAPDLASADEVRIFNPAGTAYKTYFYKTAGVGGIGWREATRLRTDATNTAIPIGDSVYVVRKNGRGGFNWKMPQPF